MNVSETFIRRPIATSLLMAGIALFGVIAYQNLAVSDLPQVDYPTLTVFAGLPGARRNWPSVTTVSPTSRPWFTTMS